MTEGTFQNVPAPSVLGIYYLCSIAGLLVVAGGLYLLYSRRIDLDKVVKEPSSLKVVFLTLKTSSPALIFFGIGVGLLAYPLDRVSRVIPLAHLQGEVQSDVFPVQVYAVISSDSLQNSRLFDLGVPRLTTGTSYKVVYVAGPKVLETLAEPAKDGHYDFGKKQINGGGAPSLAPVHDMPPGFEPTGGTR